VMQRILIAFALLFALAAAQVDFNDFQGTWTDNYGLTVKLCVTDRGLEGSISNFGFIQANLDDQFETANGRFYLSYYQTDDECPRGDFSWHVNGNKIQGRFVCYDSLSGGEWILDRVVPQNNPSDAECAALAEQAQLNTVAGSWDRVNFPDDWDICIDGDNFVASYGVPGQIGSGYQFGRVFEEGRILSGSYIEIANAYGFLQLGGVSIGYAVDQTLTSYQWGSPNSLAFVAATGGNGGSATLGATLIGSATQSSCNRNAFLATGYHDDDDVVFYFDDDSSSSTLQMIVGFGVALVAALF